MVTEMRYPKVEQKPVGPWQNKTRLVGRSDRIVRKDEAV